MDNPTTKIITTQLQNQRKFHSNDLSSLGKEDFLISARDNNFNIQSNQEPNNAQQYRLNTLLPYIANFIQSYQIPNLDFILSVGDFLDKNYEIDIPILCLSKRKDVNGLLIPNIDFFTNTMKNYLEVSANDIGYNEKLNQSIFIGSSTGEFNNNTRMLFSEKCLGRENHRSYINNLCQNTEEAWTEKYPFIQKILHGPILIEDQLKYKLLVNIDGNTSCWSRLYWQMNSNSLPVYINQQKSDIQFFDFIDSSSCYVSCNLENSIGTLDLLLETPQEEIQHIIDNGKKYCNSLFQEYKQDPQVYLQSVVNQLLSGYLSV